jgi:hypothetical protein
MTVDQLAADPSVQAANTAIEAVKAGDFTIAGQQFSLAGKVVVDERISHRGALYRTWIKRGSSATVTITDGRKSCVRPVTKKTPNTYAGDLRSRWLCRNGADRVTTTEVAAVTPLGMAQVISDASKGLASFVPSAIDATGVSIVVTVPDGTPVASFQQTGPVGGPFQMTIAQGVGPTAKPTGSFTTSAGAVDRIPALSKLKRV